MIKRSAIRSERNRMFLGGLTMILDTIKHWTSEPLYWLNQFRDHPDFYKVIRQQYTLQNGSIYEHDVTENALKDFLEGIGPHSFAILLNTYFDEDVEAVVEKYDYNSCLQRINDPSAKPADEWSVSVSVVSDSITQVEEVGMIEEIPIVQAHEEVVLRSVEKPLFSKEGFGEIIFPKVDLGEPIREANGDPAFDVVAIGNPAEIVDEVEEVVVGVMKIIEGNFKMKCGELPDADEIWKSFLVSLGHVSFTANSFMALKNLFLKENYAQCVLSLNERFDCVIFAPSGCGKSVFNKINGFKYYESDQVMFWTSEYRVSRRRILLTDDIELMKLSTNRIALLPVHLSSDNSDHVIWKTNFDLLCSHVIISDKYLTNALFYENLIEKLHEMQDGE